MSSVHESDGIQDGSRDDIRITTFGKLLVERGGVPVEDFVSTKAALLFVYLALHPGEHSRKKLAALLWSETSDEQALKNLRTVLSSVRQRVGDALDVSHDDLAIRGDVFVEVDARQFEEGYRKLIASAGALTRLQALQSLEALYQGEFLAGIIVRDAYSLEEWMDERRRQLSALYSRLLLDIVEIALRQGSYTAGLDYAWKLVHHDPLHDAAQRHLMRLLAYTNRANGALMQYERFAVLLESELGAEPEAETTALYEQIRERRLSPPRASGLFARVQPDADYVEPADDIELAQRMLNTPNCRLLTVYGISGIGKTMLATQLAFHRQHLYRDGARFVSLVSAQSARDLLEAAARALEVGFASSMTEAAVERAVIEALKPQHMLLVLDNYEQLLPETGFIQRVLLEAPSVQVFITSQSPLNLFREWLLPLKGLRVPEIGAANPETYEAVRLFDLTARRVNPRFDLDSALDDVIRICQMVDSLPLGIVIAAGWVQFMPPGAILQMMQKDLMRMEAVHQDMPTRHQTFQGLLNAMLAHLTPQEQETMMALSVFEGTFDFRAALVVAGVSPKRFKDLTDRALIQQAGEFRYCMHNFLRQAFFPQLAHSPLLRSVALRYVAHFQAWSEEFLAQNLPLHELMLVLDGEAHNLWQVPGLTDEERQRFLMHIAPAMTEYWVNRGYQARGIIPLLQAGGWNREITPAVRVRGLVALARILERTSQYDPSWDAAEEALRLEAGLNLPESRARALRVLSEICARQGKYDRAVEMLQAIIAMEAQIGSGGDARIERLISLAYEDLGEILVSQSQYDVARQTLDIAIRRWNRQGEILRESVARSYLGIIALKQGENADAFDLFTNILARAREAGNQTLIAVFAAYLGAAAMRLGDVRFAGATLRAALEIAVNIDRRTSIIHLCELFTELSLLLDRPEAGAQLFGFAAAQRERLNLPVSPHNRSEYQARQAALRSRLGDGYGWHDQSGRSAGLTAVVQLADLLADAAADAGPAR